MRSENEIANAVAENIIQCSEVDSLPIDPVGSVQSNDAVNQPNDSSCTVEVTTICIHVVVVKCMHTKF